MRLATSTCIHEKVLWQKELCYTCEQSIDACVRAGYRVLDMNFASYSRGSLPMTRPDWESWVKNIKEFSDEKGVEYSQAHAHFYNWTTVPAADVDWHEELIRRSIIGAGIMKAKWLVIHPGSVNDGVWYSYKKSVAKNVEFYKRYAELASNYGVGIAIENMIETPMPIRRYCRSTEELLDLLDALNDPIFGVCWDTGHAHMAGINQPAALRELGKNLKALHVADNFGQNDDHLAPYFGTIVWEPIMKALKEIEYEGDFTYEIHRFTYGVSDEMQDKLLKFTYDLGVSLLALAK